MKNRVCVRLMIGPCHPRPKSRTHVNKAFRASAHEYVVACVWLPSVFHASFCQGTWYIVAWRFWPLMQKTPKRIASSFLLVPQLIVEVLRTCWKKVHFWPKRSRRITGTPDSRPCKRDSYVELAHTPSRLLCVVLPFRRLGGVTHLLCGVILSDCRGSKSRKATLRRCAVLVNTSVKWSLTAEREGGHQVLFRLKSRLLHPCPFVCQGSWQVKRRKAERKPHHVGVSLELWERINRCLTHDGHA